MFRPCLYRHEVNSTYYGIKELKGKEKDLFALNLMALIGTAGGDASGGERLLEKLAQGASGQSVSIAGDYLATHPPLMERVANLRARRRD